MTAAYSTTSLLPLHIQGMTGTDAAKTGPAPRWDKVGSAKKGKRHGRSRFRAVNSNACASPAPSSAVRRWSWPTNRPANLGRCLCTRHHGTCFRAFNEVGVTLVISTHDQELIHRYGGRSVNLAYGKLVG
jgi:cell division transport system ATP-binding protein